MELIQFLDMPKFLSGLGTFVLFGSAFLMIPWACFGILHHRSGKNSQTTSFTNDIYGSVLASQLAPLCSIVPVTLIMTIVNLENSRNYVDELCNYLGGLFILQSRPSHVIPFQSILSSSPRLIVYKLIVREGEVHSGETARVFHQD